MQKFVLSDIPRENFSCKQKDIKTACQLKKAFVGTHGELNSAVKYLYYFYVLRKNKNHREAEVMLSIAIDEMKHFEQIGRLIITLGVDITYLKYPPIDLAVHKNLDCFSKKTLLDSTSTKLTSINQYDKILNNITNEQAYIIIKKIVEDEKNHLTMLKKLL